MQERSPSAERICVAAMEHFAVHGYDGSSLNQIAIAVGIRKASLYAHFQGKDDLFLAVLKIAVFEELAFMRSAFRVPSRDAGPGSIYAGALVERYETAPTMRFLLRTVYLPPVALKEEIASEYMAFIGELTDAFRAELASTGAPSADAGMMERFAQGYIGIIDSILIEIVHQKREIAMARHDVLWMIFTDALQHRGILNLTA